MVVGHRYLEVLHKALNEAKIGRFVVAVPCSKRLGLLSQARLDTRFALRSRTFCWHLSLFSQNAKLAQLWSQASVFTITATSA